jgi:circadian clock protein KaiB
VQHHQALLNAVFGTSNLTWQMAPWEESLCDPMVIETYRQQFPQLWEDRDLIVRWDRTLGSTSYSYSQLFGVGLAKREEDSTLPLQTPLPAREALQGRGNTTVNVNTYSGKPFSWYGENLKLNMNQEDFANPERSVLSSTPRSPELLDLAHTENSSISPATDKKFSPEHPSTTLPRSLDESTDTESQSQQQPTQGYVLRLFVSQNSEATEQTLKSLHELLENSIRHPYTLKVIDVFKHPDQAEANQVSATPTLVRIWPLPVRRLVGDLSDVERVLRILVTPSED